MLSNLVYVQILHSYTFLFGLSEMTFGNKDRRNSIVEVGLI